MDLIKLTNEHLKEVETYESLVKLYLDEYTVRKIVENKDINDDIFEQLENINVYNPWNSEFRGKYELEIEFDPPMSHSRIMITFTGYRWNEDLSGTLSDKVGKTYKIDGYEFLNGCASIMHHMSK